MYRVLPGGGAPWHSFNTRRLYSWRNVLYKNKLKVNRSDVSVPSRMIILVKQSIVRDHLCWYWRDEVRPCLTTLNTYPKLSLIRSPSFILFFLYRLSVNIHRLITIQRGTQLYSFICCTKIYRLQLRYLPAPCPRSMHYFRLWIFAVLLTAFNLPSVST